MSGELAHQQLLAVQAKIEPDRGVDVAAGY